MIIGAFRMSSVAFQNPVLKRDDRFHSAVRSQIMRASTPGRALKSCVALQNPVLKRDGFHCQPVGICRVTAKIEILHAAFAMRPGIRIVGFGVSNSQSLKAKFSKNAGICYRHISDDRSGASEPGFEARRFLFSSRCLLRYYGRHLLHFIASGN